MYVDFIAGTVDQVKRKRKWKYKYQELYFSADFLPFRTTFTLTGSLRCRFNLGELPHLNCTHTSVSAGKNPRAASTMLRSGLCGGQIHLLQSAVFFYPLERLCSNGINSYWHTNAGGTENVRQKYRTVCSVFLYNSV